MNSEYLQYSFVHAADPAADVDIFTFGDADYGIDGYFLSVGVTYRLPIGVKTSAAVIAAALLIAFALSAVLCRYYGKHPEKNRLLTVRRVLQFVLTPAVTAFGIFLLVLIVPLKSFDYRWTDNLLYTTGVVLMLLAFYYWLFHVPSGGSKESARPQAGKDTDDNVFDWAQAVLIAVVIAYACDYMNGLYNIFHYVSEREMFFFFCLVFLTMFSVRELKNRAAAISLGAGTVLAVLYYNLNKAAPDAADAALLNRGLAFEAASGAVLAVVFTALIRSFVYGKKEKAVSAAEKEGRTGSSHGPAAGGCGEKGGTAADRKTPGILPDPVILLPTAAFFAWIVIFRNTRMWPVTLVFLFGLFYVLYFRWPRRDRFLHNFSNGIIINFIGTVIFCQLRRYFLGFLYIRFSMQFHTSTVTADPPEDRVRLRGHDPVRTCGFVSCFHDGEDRPGGSVRSACRGADCGEPCGGKTRGGEHRHEGKKNRVSGTFRVHKCGICHDHCRSPRVAGSFYCTAHLPDNGRGAVYVR